MARPYFALPTWSDSATLSASGALSTADTPVSNLQKIQPKDIWDSGSGSTGYIIADAGSTKTFNLVSLLFTNLTSAATWRILSATSSANLTSSGASWDSGSMSAWPTTNMTTDFGRFHTLKVLSTAQSNRWMRIEITNTGSTNIQVGRLYVSNAFQPQAPIRNFRIGHVDDGSRIQSVSGGTVFTRDQSRRKRFIGILEGLSESEYYGNAHDFHRLRGGTRDMLAVLDATSTYRHHEMIYGVLRATEVPAEQRGVRRFNLRLDLSELL